MNQLKIYLMLSLVVLCAGFGWSASHYHDKYKNQVKDTKTAVTERDTARNERDNAKKTIATQQEQQRRAAFLDAKLTRELADANKKITDLELDVINGSKWLRVAATCKRANQIGSPSAGSVADATAPELTEDARRNYFAHRRDSEIITKQVIGLQLYINEYCPNAGQKP
ncbi:lysis protein [Hafnia alvei]|uniref:lysis system i-spanin subunit Rz n=1 Tax=Hafnia alvei TaxID=569 RepID=UPI002DBDA3B2|nr:lysis system i-spanin subunit Rz [Hafnia alvei]MEB7890990.1 lysis protein [Hafnia alvei]